MSHAARATIAIVLRGLLSLIAPPACLGCGSFDEGEPLCGACRRELPWLGTSTCARCGLPCPCASPCPAAGAAYDRAWAPLGYEGPARTLVAALKFDGRLAVADAMAAAIAANAPAGLLADATLVPVPTHPRRRRARGFDQGELIARALAHRSGAPIRRCLARQGAAARQLGADRTTRMRAGRIDVTVRGRPPARVVLVDDVHTTGATFQACARALRRAGSREIAAVAYARTLR